MTVTIYLLAALAPVATQADPCAQVQGLYAYEDCLEKQSKLTARNPEPTKSQAYSAQTQQEYAAIAMAVNAYRDCLMQRISAARQAHSSYAAIEKSSSTLCKVEAASLSSLAHKWPASYRLGTTKDVPAFLQEIQAFALRHAFAW